MGSTDLGRAVLESNLWTVGRLAILLFIGISRISSKKLSDSLRVELAAILGGPKLAGLVFSSNVSLGSLTNLSLTISLTVGMEEISILTSLF